MSIFVAISLFYLILDLLQHLAVGGQDVCQKSHQDGLKARDQQHCRQNQRLDMPRTITYEVKFLNAPISSVARDLEILTGQ